MRELSKETSTRHVWRLLYNKINIKRSQMLSVQLTNDAVLQRIRKTISSLSLISLGNNK